MNKDRPDMPHTPGPWVIAKDDFDDEYYVHAPDGGIGERRIAERISQPKATDGFDDAQLIAAAPEMLEALREIRGWREIGSADTPREKLIAIEQICDRVIDSIDQT